VGDTTNLFVAIIAYFEIVESLGAIFTSSLLSFEKVLGGEKAARERVG
jgi:hypothetical protein